MDIFSKKTLLSAINGGGIYGAPSSNQTVKFQFTTNLATAAANDTAGALTFAADANGNAGIWAQGKLVSSAIQKVEAAAASGNQHGGKTITVTYIVANTGAVATSTFDVIDEAGIEAYFANSNTITLDTSTFEVKIKEDGGLAVDNANGLYVNIDDLFGVDNETIGFDTDKKLKTLVKLAYAQSGEAGVPAIQLQNANDEALSEVTISALIADGIVDSTSYDAATNILTIIWKGGAVTTINMAAIIDINDVFIAADSSNLLTATNDTSVVNLGTTAKLRNAVALAESAIQGISEGASIENYVALDVVAGNDPSTFAISIDDSELDDKIDEIDSSIDAIQLKDEEQDASIDRLDSSVSAIEAAIEAMDAEVSDSVLDGSIAITVTEANGVITGVDLSATKSTVIYTPKEGQTDANLTGTAGLLTGGDIATIKQYVDQMQASGFAALDSSINVASTDGSLNFKVVEVDGLLTSGEISYVKSTVTFTAADDEHNSNLTGTEGFLTGGDIAAIKSYVDSVAERLDSSVSDKDSKEFVEVSTEMTNGALSAQEVKVTYGEFTVTPGNVTASTQGIADASAVAAAVNGALVWTIL